MRMLNDTAYFLIARILESFMWDGELVGEENLREGPGVIVANHLGAIGPVGLCCSMPMRLYPWAKGATVDKVEGPETVRKEFVEPVMHLKPPLSGAIAKGLCKISIPLLLSIGCIPVPASHVAQETTFRQSINLLKQGKFLLIVPEDSESVPDPKTGIGSFKRGFLHVGELFAQETGQRLPFYPVAVHQSGLVIIGKPIEYNILNNARAERFRMVYLLEEAIKTMYLEATENPIEHPAYSGR
jgi:1-acyl-sn-glycerol-3-phosphate acyltransferase